MSVPGAWGTVTPQDLEPPTTASLLLAFHHELTAGGLDEELVGKLVERAAATELGRAALVVKVEQGS